MGEPGKGVDEGTRSDIKVRGTKVTSTKSLLNGIGDRGGVIRLSKKPELGDVPEAAAEIASFFSPLRAETVAGSLGLTTALREYPLLAKVFNAGSRLGKALERASLAEKIASGGGDSDARDAHPYLRLGPESPHYSRPDMTSRPGGSEQRKAIGRSGKAGLIRYKRPAAAIAAG